MRVMVDSERCQGHGRCVMTAPDLFDLDDDGYAFVRNDGEVPAESEALAHQAIANCPEQAIGTA